MSDVNAVQVGGSHYKGTTYQHWDFVRVVLGGRYLEGNITKYVTRHRKKNGLQDLQKARHYLTKLIDEYNVGNVTPLAGNHRLGPYHRVEHFCDVNGVDVSERNFIVLVSNWHNREDLHIAGKMLDAMIDRETYRDEEARTQPFDDGVSSIDEEPGSGYVDQG